MPNYCAMKGCLSNSKQKTDRSFYAFPTCAERCKLWVEACGNPELGKLSVTRLRKSQRVCDLHFKKSDRWQKKLKLHAVPFGYEQAVVEDESDVIDIDSDDDNEPGTSKEPNISTESRRIQMEALRQIQRLQKKYNNIPENKNTLKTDLLTMLDFQVQLEKIKNLKSCEKKTKFFALNLYLAGPNTYKVIRTSLNLPTERSLRRTDIQIDSTISCETMACLKTKISTLNVRDTYCTVCLRKMPLKRFLFYHINKDKIIGIHNIDGKEIMEPATYAYVLLVRGLCSKWEQLLAFCFVADDKGSDDLDAWVDDCLIKLMESDHNVVCLVVDHEDLYEHFRKRIVSFTHPYFLAGGYKIYCVFDLPQLIISLRNTLMAHDLQFLDDDGSLVVAKWETIKSLCSEYTRDTHECSVLVPKLTKAHIDPDENEKKQLKYAAQVFSKSVSEALCLDSKRRPEHYSGDRGTQKLAELVNDIFDILNSSAINHHNKCKNAFTGEPYQMKAIRKFMEFLTNVKPNDCDFEDSSFNCIYGLRITIMSFSIILRDLLPKGITSLVTHRFNLDAVDRFFNLVRQKSLSEKPIPIQFFKCFRQTFMAELMKCPRTASRADNLANFLSRLNLKQIKYHKMRTEQFQKTIEVNTVDYRFELPTHDSFLYACWYLLKKGWEIHKCERSADLVRQSVNKYFDWESYDWDAYFKPPDIFIDYIKILDKQFNQSFGHRMGIGLGTGILTILKDVKVELMCACFPYVYLKRLFVRMRLFQIIRYNNRHFCDDFFRFTNTDHFSIDIM